MRLVDGPFLCGSQMTIADIICFNDISMYMELCSITPKSAEISQYPNLVKWLTVKMQSNQVIADLDKQFKEALKKAKKTNPQ